MVSLLWGHCSFLVGPRVHKVLFVPSKSLFPQSCVSSVIKSLWPPKSNSLGISVPLPDPQVGKSAMGSRTFLTVQTFLWYNCSVVCGSSAQWLYGGVNGNLLQEHLCPTQVCCTQSPCPCSRPLLTHTSTGDTQTLKGRSGSVSVGSPGVHKVLFEPSECLWWVWSLILNAILPLLPSCLGFSFALGCGVYFFGGIQHSPTGGCSAASCNFGVLAGQDERTSGPAHTLFL